MEIKIEVITPNSYLGSFISEAWKTRLFLMGIRQETVPEEKIIEEARKFAAQFDSVFEIVEGVHRFFYVGGTFVPHRSPIDIYEQWGTED